MSDIDECLRIMQEEAAEVIQAVSKVFRFGEEVRYPNPDSLSNLEQLELEIGDFLAMIDILIDKEYLDPESLYEHAENKKERLKKWSNIKL